LYDIPIGDLNPDPNQPRKSMDAQGLEDMTRPLIFSKFGFWPFFLPDFSKNQGWVEKITDTCRSTFPLWRHRLPQIGRLWEPFHG
jgi:hypothetical protein